MQATTIENKNSYAGRKPDKIVDRLVQLESEYELSKVHVMTFSSLRIFTPYFCSLQQP